MTASNSTPHWATDHGTDQHGPWAAFRLPAADGGGVTQRLRWCPPGRFMMGSPAEEPGHLSTEAPLHPVVFARGFWMFETACRQALWQAVMGETPGPAHPPTLPATEVSHDDAMRFLDRLNAAIPGLGLALPTEAQWEYACRAGTQTAHSFGPDIDPARLNFDSDGPLPVGSLPPNPWGLHEMHGNVWEWCADTWHDSYAGAPPDGAAWIAPGADTRVLRGGSWRDFARYQRAASRLQADPALRDLDIGFRCISSAP